MAATTAPTSTSTSSLSSSTTAPRPFATQPPPPPPLSMARPMLLHPPNQPRLLYPPPYIPPQAAAGLPPPPLWFPQSQPQAPPQTVSAMRPPFLPPVYAHPPIYPAPFGFTSPRVVVPLPDAQPPGVTPVATATSNPMQQSPDVLPPGTDSSKQLNDNDTKTDAVQNNQSDAWSAHRTESGAVYYYNALTGESTYEKPSGYRGEPGNAAAQPTPVSWEKVPDTDWALVATNDGKKYYYNTKTQISSWQVPPEVTELRKKQEGDNATENSMSVPNSHSLDEKGSGAAIVSAPALISGGRDVMAFRGLSATGPSSALDLVKRKLQESGAQVTSFPTSASSGSTTLEINGTKTIEATVKGLQSDGGKEKQRDCEDGNMSDLSSDSEDEDSGPTKEERVRQFKEMLKDRGVAPFSKWDKELPKIVFDPRFKAIPTYGERRSLFDHYVRTRAEEERKEKRAAQKAAVEGFKQLLEEAKEGFDVSTDYHTFKKTWGNDPRFEALERKEREAFLNERLFALKKVAEEKAQAERTAIITNFKSMLREREDITSSSRWSKVKDVIREDARYKAVKHEEREAVFNEYISELKATDDEAEKSKRREQEKLKEREREMRKRKERDEQEVERVRSKVQRKEAVASYQALLVEKIKDPQASWTESKTKIEKDPQGRASNPELDESDLEKLFREHVKMLYERCAHNFKALLAEVITPEAALRETEDGKTVINSWSTAKKALKPDGRYSKMPRKDRETLWKRHAEDLQRKQKGTTEQKIDKHSESRNRNSNGSGRYSSASRSAQDRR
ncbi:pre-mRNA-processing protein 40C isoform X2 [Silene latifolia]|uniref:pre-mRNA-processing protein 40C isoform X2 n=1 Tax=Silene latifolia TaxID=37657 RepID=UPI003D775697